MEGLVSSLEYDSKGIQIHCLDSKMIYPMYGVYMPTQQEYLNLFSNFVQQDESIKEAKHLVDLGCGSGILSVIAKEKA